MTRTRARAKFRLLLIAALGAGLLASTTQVGRMLPGGNAGGCPASETRVDGYGTIVVGTDDCLPNMPPVLESLRDRELFVVTAAWGNLLGGPHDPAEPGASIVVDPPPPGMTARTIRPPEPNGHWYGVTVAGKGLRDKNNRPYKVFMSVSSTDATHQPHATLACAIYRLTTPNAPENSIVRANLIVGQAYKVVSTNTKPAVPIIFCRHA